MCCANKTVVSGGEIPTRICDACRSANEEVCCKGYCWTAVIIYDDSRSPEERADYLVSQYKRDCVCPLAIPRKVYGYLPEDQRSMFRRA